MQTEIANGVGGIEETEREVEKDLTVYQCCGILCCRRPVVARCSPGKVLSTAAAPATFFFLLWENLLK